MSQINLKSNIGKISAIKMGQSYHLTLGLVVCLLVLNNIVNIALIMSYNCRIIYLKVYVVNILIAN